VRLYVPNYEVLIYSTKNIFERLRLNLKVENTDIKDFKSKFDKKNKVSFDPMKDPRFFFPSLDVLMLLFDVVIPWRTFGPNDVRRFYSLDRFFNAVEEGFILPYVGLDEYVEEVYMKVPGIWRNLRKSTRDDVNFVLKIVDSKNYIEAEPATSEDAELAGLLIEEDMKDEKLREIINEIYQVPSYAFILDTCNTDLIESRKLDSTLLTNPYEKPIWTHKFQKMQEALKADLEVVTDIEPIVTFIQKIALRTPRNLEIDEIKMFRKDNASIKFRKWLLEISKKVQKDPLLKIPLDDILVSDFNELCRSFETSKFYVRVILTSLVTTLTAIVFPPLTPVAAPLTQLSSGKIYTQFYRKYGDKNWVLHALDFRKRK